MPVGFLFLPVGRPRPILTNQILFSCIPKPIPFSICAPLSRLSVPRGKPRKNPRRYRRKRKLPRPKRLLPKAATRRGECGAGAGDGRRKEAQAIAKQYITTLYPRDVHALSALARCGYVTADQLRENGLRDKRINAYCKDGLVERVTHSRPGDREADRECFRLSKAGRDLCREELSCRLYNAQNPPHDLCLSDRYHAISPEERATWKTESECRDIFTEHIQQLRDQGEEERAQELWDQYQDGRISMPDAMYTRSDGVTIAFEVITNHYGEAEISAKEEAAEALGATIEYCTA